MLKYIKLRKSLYSKSKRSTTSLPRSIPHDRDTDGIIPTRLVSVQKLIMIVLQQCPLIYWPSSHQCLTDISLGTLIFHVHLPLRCWGIQPPVLSQRPVAQLTESRPSISEGPCGSGTAEGL